MLNCKEIVVNSFEILADSKFRLRQAILTFGSGNPSTFHAICGVGLPVALHFSETDGPGCIVCSMNLYRSCGATSVNIIKTREYITSERHQSTHITARSLHTKYCYLFLFALLLSASPHTKFYSYKFPYSVPTKST